MPIHCMEFYLRTGFRESQTYVDGKEHKKQGGCQGNGASPATWQQSSALMIRAQHRHGHGITIQSPISRHSIRQVGGGSSWWMTPTSGGNDGCIFSKSVGSTPGIEPGTSSTLKTNHTPRPSGHMKIIRRGTHHNMLTQPHTVLTQHMYLQSGQADSVNNGVESVQHAHFSIVLRFPQPW